MTLNRLNFDYCNLGLIWNLVLGIYLPVSSFTVVIWIPAKVATYVAAKGMRR
jgi:hypothetical protein